MTAIEGLPALTPHSPRLTALVVASALFMQNIDSTVLATALPTIADAFNEDVLRLSLALTAYMLSLAVFIPASGWVADRFGARQVFRTAILVFTLGSVLCGLAPNLTTLVIARIVQGIGGALMVPVGRLVLLRSVPKDQLVGAMAWLTVPALLGPIIGPPLGGLIVTHVSWRWIFFINIPVGLIGFLLVSAVIPPGKGAVPRRLDLVGLVLSGVALAALIFGAELTVRPMFGLAPGIAILAVGAVAAVLYWRHAQRLSRPVIDLRLMGVPTFGISVIAGTLFRIGVGAVPFLLPTMLQIGFGMDAAASGLVTFSASAGAILMKPAARPLLHRFGFRRLLVVNGALSAIFIAAAAMFRPDTPLVVLYAVLAVGGFFRSLQFTAYNTLAFADISQHRMGDATGFYSTAQQVSLTMGVVAASAFLEGAMAALGHATPAVSDFAWAFAGVGVVSALAVPVCLGLAARAGDELAGR